jgi:hypothetical protein
VNHLSPEKWIYSPGDIGYKIDVPFNQASGLKKGILLGSRMQASISDIIF